MNSSEILDDRVTVIYVVGGFSNAGPIIQLSYLISNLDRVRFNPIVFITSSKTAQISEMECYLQRVGIAFVRINSGRLASLWAAPLELARLVRKSKAVVVHPYGFRSDIICALACARPRLGNVRNNLLHNFQRMFGRWQGAIFAAINIWFLRRANCVVTCSASAQVDLNKLGLQSIVIRNSIDCDMYCSLMCSPDASKFPLHSVPTYVTVSSSIPGKNVEFLLERFAAFPHGQRRLLVIGHVPAQLLSVFKNDPRVEFRGHVALPGDVFLESHYFISASEHEGMPNAVLEALAMGRPVVLSNIDPHREVFGIIGSGVGSLFTWTADSLDDALKTVEAIDYEKLSRDCSEGAARYLDAKQMAVEYGRLYFELAGKPLIQ